MADTQSPDYQHYKLKRISFLGRSNVPIFVQNQNGPCPLLAICNVLSLRNRLDIPDNTTSMSCSRLMSIVAERILDSSPADSGSSSGRPGGLALAEYEANLRANIQDCLEVLGKLATGVDVNVRFSDPLGMEPTREVAVFDLLGITLSHGWLVDPQDTVAAPILSKLTYNEAVELAVLSQSLSSPGVGAQRAPSLHSAPSATSPPVASEATAPPAVTAAAPSSPAVADLLGLEVDMTPPLLAPPSPPVVAPSACCVPAVADAAGVADAAAEATTQPLPLTTGASPRSSRGGNSADAAAASSSGAAVTVMVPGGPTETSEASRKVLAGVVVHEWLMAHASQLTYAGLVALSEALSDNALAVFFRNNHFNTLFKHEGRLYLLVTDVGYLKEPQVVWERLDGVDGDTQMCGPDFAPYVARPAPQQHDALSVIPPGALEGLSEADAAAIAEAAGAVPGVGGHHYSGTTREEGAGGEIPPDVLAAQADADLAFAMQLQQEEEEAERARQQAARAQQQQGQQGQGHAQGAQGGQVHGYQQAPAGAGARAVPTASPQRQAQARPAQRPPAPPPKKEESVCSIM